MNCFLTEPARKVIQNGKVSRVDGSCYMYVTKGFLQLDKAVYI